MPTSTARELRVRRHRRVRGKVAGTAGRPRLAVFRSNFGISAQLIDDQAGKTLAAASWQGLTKFKGSKTDQAKEVGVLLKTNAAVLKRAVARLAELHPYEEPAVLGWRCDATTLGTAAWLGALR